MAEEKRRFGSSTRASVVDLTFAISALAIPLLAHRRLLNGDGDLARHLVTGRHILAHGPRFDDPFSFSRGGEPFLAYEWLSQVIYAAIHGLGGLPAVAALAGLLLASAFALVVRYVRDDGGDPWLAFMVGVAAAVLTSPHWLARPHLFSFVALVVLLHIVGGQRRALWLVPLFALWSNLHPGFLYGLAILAAWSAGSVFEDLRAGRPARAALAHRSVPPIIALAASLANPFGWTLHTHSLGLLRSETVTFISEFMPLAVLSLHGLVFMTVSGAIVVGLAARREWVGWPVLLVFGAAFFGALAVRRNAPMFALFALPLASRALIPVVRELPSWAFGRMRAEFARSDVRDWRVGAAAAAMLVVLLAADSRVQRLTLVPNEFAEDVFPAAAVRHAVDAGIQGRLLSQYTWGGYVLYSWPGQRVFVDSMADFFGDELFRHHQVMTNALKGWADQLVAHDISLVLLAPDAPLVVELRTARGWRVAHEDEVAVLLVRIDGEAELAVGPGTSE
jgi:hypothetical protein